LTLERYFDKIEHVALMEYAGEVKIYGRLFSGESAKMEGQIRGGTNKAKKEYPVSFIHSHTVYGFVFLSLF